ncbi:hypothetical protein [Cellulosimicrobium protaetiae]|uniref:Uncharacterized protein n=1 Tax=Cellulosimicrobium protaetiae TaxID=2587808 RepID=A0A6M5UAT6_9MICO|nr:hypothetical protein [Cellulosimicrobium protaetiae]QJW35626.1 hypothetical protein FIC82_004810 [Cellulosimicrobium protaetiae]
MTGHEPTRTTAPLVAAATLLAAGLTTACTAPDGGAVGSPGRDGPGSDPVGLVGMWRVSGADGEGLET